MISVMMSNRSIFFLLQVAASSWLWRRRKLPAEMASALSRVDRTPRCCADDGQTMDLWRRTDLTTTTPWTVHWETTDRPHRTSTDHTWDLDWPQTDHGWFMDKSVIDHEQNRRDHGWTMDRIIDRSRTDLGQNYRLGTDMGQRWDR